MTSIVVVAPLQSGKREAARALIDAGPPFDLGDTMLDAHRIFLTEHEAVFVFDGEAARTDVERLIGDPGVWRAAGAWRDCLAGRPRLAEEAFAWSRE